MQEIFALLISSSLKAQPKCHLLPEAFSDDLRLELTASGLSRHSTLIKPVILSLFLADRKPLEGKDMPIYGSLLSTLHNYLCQLVSNADFQINATWEGKRDGGSEGNVVLCRWCSLWPISSTVGLGALWYPWRQGLSNPKPTWLLNKLVWYWHLKLIPFRNMELVFF